MSVSCTICGKGIPESEDSVVCSICMAKYEEVEEEEDRRVVAQKLRRSRKKNWEYG